MRRTHLGAILVFALAVILASVAATSKAATKHQTKTDTIVALCERRRERAVALAEVPDPGLREAEHGNINVKFIFSEHGANDTTTLARIGAR